MTAKLHISPDLSLPVDYVTSTGVVYGGKGMGKTNLGSVIIEELTKARLRWCLLDPMGVSWGLRHSKNGKGPGISCVILGGVHGDIPVLPTGGAIVADLVVDESVNTIIDFSRHANGSMWTKGERIRFVTEYTTRLFERQGEMVGGKRREPMMQILDEAARYIPQQIPANSPMLAACVGAWEQVCEEGRNIGLGVTFLTQRSARMSKSVSELADVMFAFRTVGPNSLSAIMDWLGEHVEKTKIKDIAESVRELEIGQALVVSPGWLRAEKIVKIRERETFDSSATPKPGQQRQRVTGPAAKPDLAKYQDKMAATIETAKANDPKELQKTIVDLRKQLAAKTSAPAPVINQDAIRREVERAVGVYRREINQISGATAKEMQKIASLLDGASSRTRSAADDLARVANTPVVTTFPATAPVADRRPPKAEVDRSLDVAKHRKPAAPAARSDDDIGKTPQNILNALYWLERTTNKTSASRPAIAAIVGISWDSGTFRTYISRLRGAGLIVDASGLDVSLTDVGRSQARHDGLPSTLDQLHEQWLAKFGSTERRILREIIDAYPNAISRPEIGQKVNLESDSGTFRTYLSRLRSPGLITDEGMSVRASDALFPGGMQ